MTPEDEEFDRIEREAKMKPSNISFNMTSPMPKAVMTLSCEGVWVDPSLSVDEAARTVLAAIDSQIKHMVAEVRMAEREACAKVCEAQKLKYEKRAAEPEEFRDINPEVARIAGMTCDFNAAAIRARKEQP